MIQCTQCFTDNEDGAKFCNRCGQRLLLASPFYVPESMRSAPERRTSVSLAILIALILGAVQFGLLYAMIELDANAVWAGIYVAFSAVIGWIGARGFFDRPRLFGYRIFFLLALIPLSAPFPLFTAGMYISRNLK